MTSMPDLFLVVACRLTGFTALLKGFLIFSINFRLTLLLVFFISFSPILLCYFLSQLVYAMYTPVTNSRVACACRSA